MTLFFNEAGAYHDGLRYLIHIQPYTAGWIVTGVTKTLSVAWKVNVLRRSRVTIHQHILCTNMKEVNTVCVGNRAVWKVRGLAFLLRVGTLLRCGDGLFFEVPPLARDALLKTLHPLLENVLQTVDHFDISYLGAQFSWLETPKNRMERDLNWILRSAWERWIGGTPSEHSPYSADLAPWDFWASSTMKKKLRDKNFRSDQRSEARFWEVGWTL
jgi:hypothetical protein